MSGRPPITSRTGHRGDKNDCTAPGKVFKPGQQERRQEAKAAQAERTSLSALIESSLPPRSYTARAQARIAAREDDQGFEIG